MSAYVIAYDVGTTGLKTCLFEIDDLNSVKFLARIYSNTVAKYWWHDFLELNELQSDEHSGRRRNR